MANIISKIDSVKMQEIITYTEYFPNLSRRNLANTICENLEWKTPAGSLKVNSCLSLLSNLEKQGKVKLRPLEKRVHTPKPLKKEKDLFDITDKSDIKGSVKDYQVLLKQVVEDNLHVEWNDLIQRYHYLGYKKLFGSSIKYFIYLDGVSDPVGCISFTCSTTYRQKDRDKWIGWSNERRVQSLNWVLNNNRMLIFPWINIQNLGSKCLSIALSHVAGDWEVKFNFKPLLVETYVDPSRFTGAMYKAANFILIGQSSGNYRPDSISLPKEKQVKKDIYIFPLDLNYKQIFCGKPKSLHKKRPANHLDNCLKKFQSNHEELDLWEKIQYEIALICKRIDTNELKQSRQVNALTMILAIYRIVFANNFRSYDSVLCDLIDNANSHGIKLSFRRKLLPTTFCEARKRFKADTFKEINSKVLDIYEQHIDKRKDYLWKGRRVFAVDGSKINLPRETMNEDRGNYRLPCKHAFYPQGLLSCIYRLKVKVTYDVTFTNTMDEQREAITHLKALKPSDVVIYDRGYISYALLYWHNRLNIDAVFRLKKQSFKQINEFIKGSRDDNTTEISPSKKTFSNIKKKHPEIEKLEFFPLRMMKYRIGNKTYYIGSTIIDKNITISDYSEAYHARWGHEELYKTLKIHLDGIEFHGKREEFIKQELFAALGILTLNRIMANYAEEILDDNETFSSSFERKRKVNFKGQLDNLLRIVEPVIASDSNHLESLLKKNNERAVRGSYKTRSGRKSIRKSHRKINKWQKTTTK